MIPILITTAVITAIGLACAILLAFFEKRYGVKTDESVALVEKELPGANCGGCGYPGCSGYAVAIVKANAPLNKCGPGGQALADKLELLTGRDSGRAEPAVAVVHCGGDGSSAKRKSYYNGISDCISAMLVAGGWKGCAYGCLGYGGCVRACHFGALSIVDGVAVVNPDVCVGCGECVKKCPLSLISIVPKTHRMHVLCKSPEKGAVVMRHCSRGCIGCGICVKLDGGKTLKMNGNLAVVDYTQAPVTNENIETIMAKCPKKCIILTSK